jgi:hypothetical protein
MKKLRSTDRAKRTTGSFPSVLLFVFFSALALRAHAAPLVRDLGEGLVYFRISTLPADLPTAEAARKQPCVLDVRYVRGDPSAGTALDAWLKFHATSRTPVLLLINAETEATVLASLAARLPAAGLVVIGTASPGLTPDLVLKITPTEERRAYDALATGATIESLLNDNPTKIRDDEARLVKDYARRPDPAAPTVAPLTDDYPSAATDSERTTSNKPSVAPIDSALQRAVHLHRALKALKKI